MAGNRVINVNHHCHEATTSPNVIQKSILADATSVTSGLIFVT